MTSSARETIAPAAKRVALVTGAGAGLGAAFAAAMARQDCRVVVNNRNRWYGEPSAERVTKALRRSPTCTRSTRRGRPKRRWPPPWTPMASWTS